MVKENEVEEKLALADSVERKYSKALDILTKTEKTIIKYAFFFRCRMITEIPGTDGKPKGDKK